MPHRNPSVRGEQLDEYVWKSVTELLQDPARRLDEWSRRQQSGVAGELVQQRDDASRVGRLAGGVAHDFNNVLSVILSYSEMLCADMKAGDPIRADIEEIKKAGLRAADLTRQLLAFSRRQVLEARVLDLNQAVAGMEKMLRRLLGADIELTILPASGLRNVKADPGQIEQILMNLAVNARDAMPQGGKLTIEISNLWDRRSRLWDQRSRLWDQRWRRPFPPPRFAKCVLHEARPGDSRVKP